MAARKTRTTVKLGPGTETGLDWAARRAMETKLAAEKAPAFYKKMSKDELLESLVKRDVDQNKLRTELKETESEKNALTREIEDYKDIRYALAKLAAARLKRDQNVCRTPFDAKGLPLFDPKSEPTFLEGERERHRATTYPQALDLELARIKESIAEFAVDEDAYTEEQETIDRLEEDRALMLEMLGLDDCEWDHFFGWKVGG